MSDIETTARRIFSALILASLLVECTVGPEFKRPAAPEVAVYTTTPLSEHATSSTALDHNV